MPLCAKSALAQRPLFVGLLALQTTFSFYLPPIDHHATPFFQRGCRKCLTQQALWLPTQDRAAWTSTVETSTLHTQLKEMDDGSNVHWDNPGSWDDHGLLRLERTIPEEILNGLNVLAYSIKPFKAVALRGTEVGWANELTRLLKIPMKFPQDHINEPAVPTAVMSAIAQEPHHRYKVSNSWKTTEYSQEYNVRSTLVHWQASEAARWISADIERMTAMFGDEINRLFSADVRYSACGDKGMRIDITTKLELLQRGKCPRFHLDKVPLRVICTYVGPGTEWLDAYNLDEMENNRDAPPACNSKIGIGREVQHANTGDVLFFRGQIEGTADARAVAHRSPDMSDGQRRLVITLDIGDVTSLSETVR